MAKETGFSASFIAAKRRTSLHLASNAATSISGALCVVSDQGRRALAHAVAESVPFFLSEPVAFRRVYGLGVLLADQRGIEPPPAVCQRHKSAAIPTAPERIEPRRLLLQSLFR